MPPNAKSDRQAETKLKPLVWEIGKVLAIGQHGKVIESFANSLQIQWQIAFSAKTQLGNFEKA